MLLIKFGGSVISDKSEYRKFRENVVRKIARYIPKKDVIIVHGAGSFGHILAKEYRIISGFEDWKRIGFSKIQLDMIELNSKIVRILIEEDIPVVSLPPHSFMIMDDRQNLDIFDYFVSYGFVPLTYGDAVFDASRGINILSGDILMLELAKRFKPEKTIFLTDVDGIYTRPPKNGKAKLIKEFDRKKTPKTAMNVTDVTGGMDLKIDVMKEMAQHTKVYVINGLHPERIVDVLNDRDFIGTVIK